MGPVLIAMVAGLAFAGLVLYGVLAAPIVLLILKILLLGLMFGTAVWAILDGVGL